MDAGFAKRKPKLGKTPYMVLKVKNQIKIPKGQYS